MNRDLDTVANALTILIESDSEPDLPALSHKERFSWKIGKRLKRKRYAEMLEDLTQKRMNTRLDQIEKRLGRIEEKLTKLISIQITNNISNGGRHAPSHPTSHTPRQATSYTRITPISAKTVLKRRSPSRPATSAAKPATSSSRASLPAKSTTPSVKPVQKHTHDFLIERASEQEENHQATEEPADHTTREMEDHASDYAFDHASDHASGHASDELPGVVPEPPAPPSDPFPPKRRRCMDDLSSVSSEADDTIQQLLDMPPIHVSCDTKADHDSDSRKRYPKRTSQPSAAATEALASQAYEEDDYEDQEPEERPEVITKQERAPIYSGDEDTEWTMIGQSVKVPTRKYEKLNLENPCKAVGDLAELVFTREMMATHSISGKGRKSKGGSLKPQLPVTEVEEICKHCAELFDVEQAQIKWWISKRGFSAAKTYKKRLSKESA